MFLLNLNHPLILILKGKYESILRSSFSATLVSKFSLIQISVIHFSSESDERNKVHRYYIMILFLHHPRYRCKNQCNSSFLPEKEVTILNSYTGCVIRLLQKSGSRWHIIVTRFRYHGTKENINL